MIVEFILLKSLHTIYGKWTGRVLMYIPYKERCTSLKRRGNFELRQTNPVLVFRDITDTYKVD